METALPLRDALARVDALRDEIEALRPLPADALGRAMQRLRLEWTYHSNAIEGNSLDYGETRALLLHGVTAHGKPLKDHLDIRRHREVLDFLEEFVRSHEPLRLVDVREFHRLLMGDTYEVHAETPDGQRITREERGGEYKTHPNHVRTATGEIHYYATPEETPARMQDLMNAYSGWREQVEQGELHPLVAAASLHHGFVEIHPFPDGNGRLSRILMNLLLMRAGYPPAVIRQENRAAYFGALAEADAGNLEPFTRFVADELAVTMELYLRALRNEHDPDAFSRRVALLKREVEIAPTGSEFDTEQRARLADTFVLPLLEATTQRVRALQEVFGNASEHLRVTDARGKDHYGGQETLTTLREGNWLFFKALWSLSGLRIEPHFSMDIRYEGRIHDSHFELWVAPGNLHYIADASGFSEDRRTSLIDGVFDQVIAAVEEVLRRRSS